MASSPEFNNVTSKQFNLSGALVFWMYNVAALYLLYEIGLALILLQRQSSKLGQSHHRRRLVLVYIALSVTSFATLSFNMLNVLIQSYFEWIPQSPATAKMPFLSRLWVWSIQSSLFTDFAQQMTATPQRWFWSQSELGLSMVTSYWMGIEAKRVNAGRPLPKLWAFFALLQILPTSMVLNLFLLARLLAPMPMRQEGRDAKKRHPLLVQPYLWSGAGAIYFLCLLRASSLSANGDDLIQLVLFARLLLVLPFVLKLHWIDDQHSRVASSLARMNLVVASGLVAGALTVVQGYHALQASRSELDTESWRAALGQLWSAKDSHPAVASLAYDVIQGIFSIGIWSLTSHFNGLLPFRDIKSD